LLEITRTFGLTKIESGVKMLLDIDKGLSGEDVPVLDKAA
jgi:hypothetical protein